MDCHIFINPSLSLDRDVIYFHRLVGLFVTLSDELFRLNLKFLIKLRIAFIMVTQSLRSWRHHTNQLPF